MFTDGVVHRWYIAKDRQGLRRVSCQVYLDTGELCRTIEQRGPGRDVDRCFEDHRRRDRFGGQHVEVGHCRQGSHHGNDVFRCDDLNAIGEVVQQTGNVALTVCSALRSP